MEADWEVEIGGGAPVIEADWTGYVDLTLEPERVAMLAETAAFPALAEALARLNSAASPVWTSKCDVWQVEKFDPDEMDAPPGTGTHSVACYIDLLPRGEDVWSSHEQARDACEALCRALREIPLRSCRADLVVRRAFQRAEVQNFGVTGYLTACGSGHAKARETLASALAALVGKVLTGENVSGGTSKLQ